MWIFLLWHLAQTSDTKLLSFVLSACFLCSSGLPGRTSLTKALLATPGLFSKTPCLAFIPLFCAFKIFIHHVPIPLSHSLVHNLSVYFGWAAALSTAVLLQRKIVKNLKSLSYSSKILNKWMHAKWVEWLLI